MKFKKNVGLLCLEIACIFVAMLILITLFAGGVKLPFGPLWFRSTSFERPLLILVFLLGLKKLVSGRIFGNWACLTLLHRRRKSFALPADMLIGSILVLLTLYGLCTFFNPIQRGLQGTYYDNPDWQEPSILTRADLSFDRRTYTFPQLSENYSVTWKGAICLAASGEYEFATVSRDDSTLLVDDQVVVQNSGDNDLQKIAGTISLEEGCHSLTIHHRFTETYGGPILKTYLRRPGKQLRRLPAYRLLQTPLPKSRLLLGQGLEIAASLCMVILMIVSGIFGLNLLSKIPHLSSPAQRKLSCVSLFLLVLIAHAFWSPIHTPFDSGWTVYTATSILAEGNLNLDEFQELMTEEDHRLIRDHGHIYDKYPPGTPLLSVPFVYILDATLQYGINRDLIREFQGNVEKGIAAALVAIVTVIIFQIGFLCPTHLRDVITVTLIFAFCTSAWSTASRALWQHAANMLVLSLALYLLLRAQQRVRHTPWLIRLTGVVLAYSFLARPTNVVAILVLSAYIVIAHREHLPGYLLWSGLVAVPFSLWNLHTYRAIFPPYYTDSGQLTVGWGILEGLAGSLISPSRGLFIFTPVLLFSIYGIILKIKQDQMTLLDTLLIVIMVLHWILSSAHHGWWGGHTYGPRYLTDIVPYLIYFLIPVFQHRATLQGGGKMALDTALFITIAFSFFVHYQGATNWVPYLWNVGPVPVEDKLWEWGNLQFLQGL